MALIVRKSPIMQLPPVPSMSKGLQMTVQPINTPRKTATFSGQPGQIVTQFGINALDRISFALVKQRQMIASSIFQAVIQWKLVTVILVSRRLIDQPLSNCLTPLPNRSDSQQTAALPVNNGHDVGFVFLPPMKVNSSSCSATSTGPSGFGNESDRLSAYSLNQLAAVP